MRRGAPRKKDEILSRKKGEREVGGGVRERKVLTSANKGERTFQWQAQATNMSSDDDAPAPSPSAAVLARRASREAKSMREEKRKHLSTIELYLYPPPDSLE